MHSPGAAVPETSPVADVRAGGRRGTRQAGGQVGRRAGSVDDSVDSTRLVHLVELIVIHFRDVGRCFTAAIRSRLNSENTQLAAKGLDNCVMLPLARVWNKIYEQLVRGICGDSVELASYESASAAHPRDECNNPEGEFEFSFEPFR